VSSPSKISTNSSITGLAGQLSTSGVNPIVKASSGTKLKGQGQSSTASLLRTSLTGQVISVLPNGNLVVEASRKITMNNQHEIMVVRGVLRPGDISASNTVSSTSLMDLEVELKGKGVISDATRQANPLVRALLWAIGF
jgi:flagellar L-ring protein precursor FlgH